MILNKSIFMTIHKTVLPEMLILVEEGNSIEPFAIGKAGGLQRRKLKIPIYKKPTMALPAVWWCFILWLGNNVLIPAKLIFWFLIK